LIIVLASSVPLVTQSTFEREAKDRDSRPPQLFFDPAEQFIQGGNSVGRS